MLNTSDDFALPSVDKVTVSVIVKVEAPAKVHSTQLGSHVNESSTLQSINDVSNDLQKLLKYLIVLGEGEGGGIMKVLLEMGGRSQEWEGWFYNGGGDFYKVFLHSWQRALPYFF